MRDTRILCLLLQLPLAYQASSGASPYRSAAHYWPLDKSSGIYDVKTNTTAEIIGSTTNINFAGRMGQFLYKEGSTWVDLGDFNGTCLSEPALCTDHLAVALWLRYSGQDQRKKQVFLATTSKLRPRGFVIFSEIGIKTQNVVIVKVTSLDREWSGSLQLPPGVWHHVMFTWSNSSGLSVYRNAELVSSAVSGRVAYHPTVTAAAVPARQAHLSLSGSNDGRKRTKSDCSYDDIAVWYRNLAAAERDSLLRQKVEPPQLLTCKKFSTWLEVSWERPEHSYDVLRGYDVWLSDPDHNERKVGSVTGTSYNATGLAPESTYRLRVQNKLINSKLGRSRDITCTTTPSTLGTPSNLTVETTSVSAIFLRWGPPKKAAEQLAGYKIVYGAVGSRSPNETLDVGPLEFFLLTKLLTNQEYVIRVVAYSTGDIRDSEPVLIRARTDENDALSVSNVMLRPVMRAIRVSWTPPRDRYKKFAYTVLLAWQEGSLQKMVIIYQGNATAYEHVVARLGRPHAFLVIARVVGRIPAVPITASPGNITVVSLDWDSVSLLWDPPPAGSWFVDSYRVVVASGRDTRVVTSAKPRVRVDRLKQLTNYWVNVEAGNKAGYGPPMHSFLRFVTPDRDECRDGSSRCHGHAACTNTEGSFFCKCMEGYVGDGYKCEESEESATCSKDTSFGVVWSETLVEETELATCPTGTTGVARRRCAGSVTSGAPAWLLPDLTGCVSRWLSDAMQQLDDPNVNTTSLARTLADLTDVESGREVYAGDLRLIVDVIGTLSRGMAGNDSSGSQPLTGAFVEAVVSTSSNVLDPKNLDSWSYMPENSKVARVRTLIDSLDVIAMETGKAGHQAAPYKPNVVMKVAALDQQTKDSGLIMSDGPETAADGRALFPASILRGMPVKYATMVSFKTLGPLLEPGSVSAEGRADSSNVSSAVLSLTLHPPRAAPFKDPVVLVLRHDSSNQERAPECVFLDINKSRAEWSGEGCHVAHSNASHTTCHCDHLTSFAVLMSVKENVATSIPEAHRIALSVISYVGVSVSVVALCLAFFTFSFFRFLKSFRVFIHKNLAVSLILAQLVFLFGIDKTSNKIVCQVIAVAMHYFFLVAFCWMALEGVILYLMLVKVFRSKSTPTKTKVLFSLVGWGAPALIVSTAGVVNVEGYGTDAYCWLSLEEGFIWWFVGPVLIIIAFNFVCLGITFSVMAKKGRSRGRGRSRRIRYWAKACTLLTCILGLSWMFGVMYINHKTLFMAYFFTVFNSLQGLFIFLFHCLGDEKVRQEYTRLLCCRARGDYLLTKPSDSSSKTDSHSKSKHASASFQSRYAQTPAANGTPESKKHLFVVQTDGHIKLRAVSHNAADSSMYSEAHDSDASNPSDHNCQGSGDEMCGSNGAKK